MISLKFFPVTYFLLKFVCKAQWPIHLPFIPFPLATIPTASSGFTAFKSFSGPASVVSSTGSRVEMEEPHPIITKSRYQEGHEIK